MAFTPKLRFGPLLKHLRKQAGMTQRDLAAALGYSDSLISNLEKEQRQPDLQAVMQWFIPALGLQDDPQTAAQLIEQAAMARGERPPAAMALQRTTRVVIQEELDHHPARLPSPPTALIGRAAEVKQLGNRLFGHSGRLLTLVGPPGVGKTTLALAVGAALQAFYADGAYFIPLAAVNDPALVATTLVTALKLPDSSSKPPQTRLIEHLRRKEMLLVMDNFEQLLSYPFSNGRLPPRRAPQIGEEVERGNRSVELLAELLAECAGLRLLVTSRERLHLRAEQRYRVPPLDLTAAVELFAQRAIAVDANFVLTAASRPTIEAICHRLDRLPLAIELCAAQTELFSPAQLLTRVQARPLDLLVAGAHDLTPQHRTLRLAIQRSYTLLSEEERTLLRSLGVFAGGFALPELEWMWAGGQESCLRKTPSWSPAILQALISKSLVHKETLPDGEQRFLLLETIREFAVEQLRAKGEETLVRQRHYATYLHLFRLGDSHLRTPEATTWWARLEPEHDNLRHALQWALDEKCDADAVWLMLAAAWFWFPRGHAQQQAKWFRQLLRHRQALPPDLRLALLIMLHALVRSLREFQPIEDYKDEMMQLLERCMDNLLLANGWYWLAAYATEIDQANIAWERSIALARSASGAWEPGAAFALLADRDFTLTSALWGYTTFLIEQGKVAQATLTATEGLKLSLAREDHFQIGNGLGNLGFVALLRGDRAEAYTFLHEAVALAVAAKYQWILGRWQPLLGIVMLYGGDVPEASRLLNESLPLCLELKDKSFLAQNCTYLAETSLWAGELAQAEQWLSRSLSYQADLSRITLYEVMRLFVTGRLATAQGQYLRAATLFGLAAAAHNHIHYAIAGPLRALADAALATVQAALEPAAFAEAFAAGQQMTLGEAFATILAPAPLIEDA